MRSREPYQSECGRAAGEQACTGSREQDKEKARKLSKEAEEDAVLIGRGGRGGGAAVVRVRILPKVDEGLERSHDLDGRRMQGQWKRDRHVKKE